MSKNSIILYAELSYNDTTIHLYGTRHSNCAYVTDEGIEGWYSTPDSKWDLTERSYADGAYSLDEKYIVYAARVVTMHVGITESNRSNVLDWMTLINGCAHHEVTLRVVDDWSDTYVTGYATVESEATWDQKHNEMEVTIQCPDPRRYASEESDGWSECELSPSSAGISGGLWYGDDGVEAKKAGGLSYGDDDAGLSYGEADGEVGQLGTLTNHGSSIAYPIATVYGPLEDGFSLIMTTGGTSYTVTYDNSIPGNPVELDYRTRRATVADIDKSMYLTDREFSGIEPGYSATFVLQALGEGSATVVVRDTYI